MQQTIYLIFACFALFVVEQRLRRRHHLIRKPKKTYCQAELSPHQMDVHMCVCVLATEFPFNFGYTREFSHDPHPTLTSPAPSFNPTLHGRLYHLHYECGCYSKSRRCLAGTLSHSNGDSAPGSCMQNAYYAHHISMPRRVIIIILLTYRLSHSQ